MTIKRNSCAKVLSQWVGTVARYVLKNKFFDSPGIAFGEIVDHNLRPRTGNDVNVGKEYAVLNFYTRNIGVEYEVVGAPNQFAGTEGNAFVVELNLIGIEWIFKTATAEFFCHDVWTGI